MIFMSSSLALFKLAPQVSVEPFLIIRQDTSDGIVRYEPISYKMASKNQLMETFVRQYVLLRNTIIADEKEMQTRWFPGGMMNFCLLTMSSASFPLIATVSGAKSSTPKWFVRSKLFPSASSAAKKSGLEGGLQNLRPLDHHAQSEYPGFDSEHALLDGFRHGLFPPRPRVCRPSSYQSDWLYRNPLFADRSRNFLKTSLPVDKLGILALWD